MRTIPKTILDIIRSDAIDSAFVLLIHLDSGAGVHLRYARYASDVSYGGNTFTAWPFAGGLRMAGKGHSVPTVELRIEDAVQVLRPFAIASNWFRDWTATLTVVCVKRLAVSYTWNERTYNVLRAVPSGGVVTLTLGGKNPMKLRFPADRYWATQCPYAKGFKDDPRCGYAGAGTSCDGQLATCVAYGNEERWGGFLALDPDAAKLVIPVGMRR